MTDTKTYRPLPLTLSPKVRDAITTAEQECEQYVRDVEVKTNIARIAAGATVRIERIG